MPVPRWNPSLSYSRQEEYLLGRLTRNRKLYRFLRQQRHEIFDDSFQDELASMYRDTGAGKDPVPPALLAMACLLQGYQGVSDAEAVELTVVDLRWQLVLGCLGATAPAFSQGALHDFRQRSIEHDMDRRLLERTAEVARRTKGFDYKKLPKTLRVAVDSAPLEGAGRVEDTINLLAHAARKVVVCAAEVLGLDADAICRQAGIELLLASSVKRGLDRVWTDPGERNAAVSELMDQIEALQRWLESHASKQLDEPPLVEEVETLQRIIDQDIEPDPEPGGGRRIRKGVAADRRISIEDSEMRHGRKSSSKRIDGFKRHIARNLDDGIIEACALTPANQPEEQALELLNGDIEKQGKTIDELYIDRGYVSSPVVGVILKRGGKIICRPWRQANRGLFTKEDFAIDLGAKTATCPAGAVAPVRLGATVTFPANTCGPCSLRAKCTTAKDANGRSVHIADNEGLQQRLREMARTPAGRAQLRRRVPVEHGLAHAVQRQGKRARYIGTRKNLYDLRRASAIQNLETAQRMAA